MLYGDFFGSDAKARVGRTQETAEPTSFPGSSLFLPRGRKREDPGYEVAAERDIARGSLKIHTRRSLIPAVDHLTRKKRS